MGRDRAVGFRSHWGLWISIGGIGWLFLTGAVGCEKQTLDDGAVEKENIAFMNSRWRMSQTDVEQSNGRPLRFATSYRKFYTPTKEVEDPSKYRVMQEDNGRPILGRESEIIYLFFEDQLFAYYVFVHDREPEPLDQEMRKYLTRRFGPRFIAAEENGPLRMIWNQKNINVNYWFFKNELNLSDKYTSGYGVVYRPIEDAISG